MKIGIDISQVVYGTGVSTYTKNLVENLLKIDKKNEYILFGSSLRSRHKLKEFIKSLDAQSNLESKLYFFPPIVLSSIWNKFRVYPIDNFTGSLDVFHSSDWLEPPIKSKSTKKVTTVHDMTPFLFESSTHPKIVANHKKRLSIVKNECNAIIADSKTTKDDLVKFLEIPEEKIRVIYLAAPSKFKPQDESKVAEVLLRYKIKKPYILSVGTQEPRKNIEKLIDVFEKINSQIPELNLVLTGKYGWGNKYRELQNVNETGFVDEEDLISLYCGAKVFVYPSLYEGFGLPVLEAMACGVPVVTSNNSSMAEIAKDAAILVDPRNEAQLKKAIEFVLSLDSENYQKVVRASLDRARNYSWTKTARETLAVYEEIVKSN